MEANNKSNPSLSKSLDRKFFLDKMLDLFPAIPLGEAWKNTLKLSNSSQNDHYKKLLSSINYQELQNGDVQKNLRGMFDAGFDIQHIMLYLDAPKESKLGDRTTQEEYLKLWNKQGHFKPHTSSLEVLQRSTVATKSLATLIGVSVVLPGVVVGLSINNPAVVETGQVLASGMVGIVEDFGEAISNPTFKNVFKSTLTILGFGVAGFALKGKTKEANAIDLRSKIRDGAKNDQNKELLLEELEQIPIPTQHLISHFSPEETCLFLVADDVTQETMWKKHPPSFEQRCLSNLTDGKEPLFERMWQQAKLAGSFWDKEEEALPGPVNLKESLFKLREHKKNLLEQGFPSSSACSPSSSTPH